MLFFISQSLTAPHCNHSGLLTSKNLWCGPCPHPECPSSPLLPPIITHGTTAAYVQATHITTCAAPILPPRPRLTAAGIPAIPLFYSPPLCLHSGWTAPPDETSPPPQCTAPAPSLQVDGSLHTSHPDVYAIGDVATFPLKMYGGVLGRQEHVANCRETAAHAAKVLTVGKWMAISRLRGVSLRWRPRC